MNIEYMRAPHRRGDSTTSAPSPNAALLIDFDNVTMGIRSNLGQELRKLLDSDIIRGKVAVQRAYADWRRYPQYIVPLSESSIDLIFAPAYGSSRKNATDIRLAIDALELVFTRPEIGTFILLSGDSDFSSLVLKLKEYGKYVIGVGLQESASDILVQNCDEYYSYNSLSGMTSAEEMDTAKLDPWELVERALQRMVDRSDVMRSDRLKQVMLEIDPSFDEKAAGFTKFNRFLAEASHRDLVRMRKGENGQYEVAPGKGAARGAAAEPPAAASAVAEQGAGSAGGRARGPARARSSERRRSRGSRGGGGRERETPARQAGERQEPERQEPERQEPPSAAYEVDPKEALRMAYDQLAEVVRQLYEGGEPLRDSMAKRKLLERDSTFDEGALGFRKFSHFLRQAHDEGVVDLIQGEDGNYYLQPAGEGDARPSRRPEEPRPDEAEVAPGSGGGTETRAASRGPSADAADDAAGGGAIAAAKEAARRTLGRFRRGSRGGSAAEPSASSSRPHIGPVETPATTEPEEERREATARRPEPEPRPEPEREPSRESERTRGSGAASGPDPTGSAPAAGASAAPPGLGRFRRGSRGRPPTPTRGPGPGASRGPAEASGAESRPGTVTGSGSSRPRDDGSGGPSETGAVDHMIRNYSGVGKRTAEALVDQFGDGVFEVIDNQPERLTEVISQRRADAVVAARQAERARD